METTIKVIKDITSNRVQFFSNGKQIFPSSISGNIVSFSNGQTILI